MVNFSRTSEKKMISVLGGLMKLYRTKIKAAFLLVDDKTTLKLPACSGIPPDILLFN